MKDLLLLLPRVLVSLAITTITGLADAGSEAIQRNIEKEGTEEQVEEVQVVEDSGTEESLPAIGSSEEEMYRIAEAKAVQAYPNITTKMMRAFREKESHSGIILTNGLGDPIARHGVANDCANGSGYTNIFSGNFHAASQYQLDGFANCPWYKAQPHLVNDLVSTDPVTKQAAIDVFALKAAELISGKQEWVVNSGYFSEGDYVIATACAYNQGTGGVTRDIENQRGLCASSTRDPHGNNYGVSFMNIYNSI